MECSKEKTRVKDFAIMASGTGTNALSLIRKSIELDCPPRFVVVNKEESPLLELAKSFGLPTYYIPTVKKGIDQDFESRVLTLKENYKVEWLFLAGFLKILSTSFLHEFNQHGFNQVINIHPSLLPKYPGLGGYKKAFQNRDAEFGHTLHLVTDGVDEGPIIYQKVLSTKGLASLDDMISVGKEEENKSYVRLLKSLIKNGCYWDAGQLCVSWEYP